MLQAQLRKRMYGNIIEPHNIRPFEIYMYVCDFDTQIMRITRRFCASVMKRGVLILIAHVA